MARWRAFHQLLASLASFTLIVLLPAPASAQLPSVAITNAPSFAERHSSYTITVTTTGFPFATTNVALTSNFPDVTFSDTAWALTCGFTACSSSRSITVTTGNTGGRNLTVTASAVVGSFKIGRAHV